LELARFLRIQLGCACPEALLARAVVREVPEQFRGLPGDCLITVADRLLVLVIWTTSWQEVSAALELLCQRGRELRDTEGFNRFRLVLVTPEPDATTAALRRRFAALADRDQRLHLHLIRPQQLPSQAREGAGR
jgi:hypothetical protein